MTWYSICLFGNVQVETAAAEGKVVLTVCLYCVVSRKYFASGMTR